ncbi:uncharacterized protein LOC581522 isoform X3 [Strongylocentrotus purpuratus]|uniref:Fibronectin type-III domain-containing protein n=1 Tax=Strongylocentrotus purpuratus TaxID=7668 RepID=A0A7M7T4K9_STRPU|nr:uncharacterized protein LOC581522 isoform X3 [Strongylocentrotus purpuratus]
MTLNWRQDEYFESLLAQPEDPEAHRALELLVDDIHKDKEKTINAFISHYGSEDFLWGIVRLLAEKNARVAGNAAYIFGTLAEHDVGQLRVMSLVKGSSPHHILTDLTGMLSYDDTECVMNAAGTMGTLAESKAGRDWMLGDSCLDDLLRKVTSLLSSSNMWTASNAALVLARLSIAEQGCQRVLNHYSSLQILTKLVESLGMDEAGRGMNAAFAIGRLCDIDDGRLRLLNHRDSEKMLESLCCMLTSKDSGCGKNACYALSCLASSDQGHKRLLLHKNSDLMLHLLAQQLSNDDGETAWFAAMTLRTLAGKRQGVLRLRDHADVVPLLKQISLTPSVNPDLLEEVDLTLELLKHLARPEAPGLEVKGPHEIEVTWPVVELKSGSPVTYTLFCESKQVYHGPDTVQLVSNLRPFTKYSFKLQIHTEGDDSPHSNDCVAKTQDAVPDAPEALRILGITTSQIRLGWAPPQYNNGGLKGYVVYNGKHQVEMTSELNSIISGLAPKTTYELHVCACNHKGKGPKSSISATTEELGKHAPSKPTLTARGRSQIHVTWAPPDYPLGRIYRFEVTMNGKVVYSGRELSFTVKNLTPNTEYSFTVIAVTSEGKCESDPVKKKTGKDEYNVQSTAPVFFSHPTKVSLEAKPSNKAMERSHPRSLSRHSKKREHHLKPGSSPASFDTSISRPISAASSSWSGNHKKRSSRVRSARKQRESHQSSTDDARKNRHIAALKMLERGQKSSTGEESSEWSEEDQWKRLTHRQVAGSNHTTVNPSRHSEPKDEPEFLSVTVSYKDCSDDDALHREGATEKSASAESNEIRRKHKVSRKDVTFDDKVFSEKRDRRKQHPVGAHGEGLPSEGILEHFPADSVDRRALMRLSMSMKRQQTALGVEHEGLKYPGDVMSSHIPQRTGRLHHASKQDSNSKKQRQLESLAHGNRLSFNPSLAMQDLRLQENSNTSNNPTSGAGENKDFTLMANGCVVYQEKPDSAEKKEHPMRRKSSVQEDINDVEKLPDQLPDRSPRDVGSLRGSWNDVDRFGFSDSDNDVFDEAGGMVSGAPSLLDDNNNHNSNSSTRGDKSLSAINKGLKRDILSRNPLMDHALPSRSILADHGSFYQRTNTFISSHRPTLKKNLARLVAPGPHNMPPPSSAQTSTYDPEFPSNKKSGGGANSYQFIPTQFRTQPVNLPTPLLPRGNTLASLQDRSAFVRKLEALSHLSSSPGAKSAPFCNDCGKESDPKPVSLRYSHKHESHALHGPRLRSGHSGMMSPPVARRHHRSFLQDHTHHH